MLDGVAAELRPIIGTPAPAERMTDYLMEQIKPKPGSGKKHGDNVIAFKKTA